MRYIIFLSILFFSFNVQGQNAYFVDKKGKKTIMRDDAVDFYLIDQRLSYKQVGKTWEKYIKFSDLDYAKWDGLYFKVLKIGKSKRDRGLFLHAETKTHKLFTVAVSQSSTSSTGFTRSTMWYRVLIVDAKYNVIEDMEFKSFKGDKEEREKVGPLIRKYFSDCDTLIQNLNSTGEDEDKIQDFLSSPAYINCQ
ncbi:hypothetical protein J2X31_002458 [Flavobacterium arsenatis]|uniref:DUF4468 domain-containing protein n=1 Tax=Flavobacterium arsenatis TaxID=1484332 RepID=A0ABU1TRD7_9FLAO|nr:hypothetical protein [Flavobacterium arsenatis]MDR6968435.1 hypothetical protein [Flavobacterium arsenatis]